MKKYLVEWRNVITFTCSHEVEAESEQRAIEIARSLDSGDIQTREECDNEDHDWEVTEL